jgi:hypothetical protein
VSFIFDSKSTLISFRAGFSSNATRAHFVPQSPRPRQTSSEPCYRSQAIASLRALDETLSHIAVEVLPYFHQDITEKAA